MYSIPDLFIWLYVSGVTPDSLIFMVAVFAMLIFAVVVWINCYVAQRHANKIRRAMDIQHDLDRQDIDKAAKVGDVITPRESGFKWQRSND